MKTHVLVTTGNRLKPAIHLIPVTELVVATREVPQYDPEANLPKTFQWKDTEYFDDMRGKWKCKSIGEHYDSAVLVSVETVTEAYREKHCDNLPKLKEAFDNENGHPTSITYKAAGHAGWSLDCWEPISYFADNLGVPFESPPTR